MQPAPVQSSSGPYPGPPARKSLVWIVVVVVVLAAVLLIGFFAIVVLWAAPVQTPRVVALTSEVPGASASTVSVARATPRDPLAAFRAALAVNGTTVGELSPLADGATDGVLSFSDADHDSLLSPGDVFTIGQVSPGSYRLSVAWVNLEVAGRTWTISAAPAPTVAFESPTETTTAGTFTLSPSYLTGGCNPNCPISSFKVQIFNETVTHVALCSSPPTVANTANPPWLCTNGGISIGFTDLNANAKLDTIDFFVIKGVASSTAYTVSLIWVASGNEIASALITK